MAKPLTEIGIKNLKPTGEPREIRDGGARGLYLWIGSTGVKSFVVRYRLNGKPKKLTLGRWVPPEDRKADDPQIGDPMSLGQAHKLAADVMLQLARGRNPAAAKRDEAQAKQKAAANTFRSVAERYFTEVCGMHLEADGTATFNRDRKKRSAPEQWHTLKRQIFPTLGGKAFDAITKNDIRDWLDKLATGKLRNDEGQPITGGIVAANCALAIVRLILLWREEQSDDYRAPSFRGLKRDQSGPRKRYLSDDELRIVWRVASEADTPFNCLVRFLLLTAARRTEASEMRRGEVTEIVYTREERDGRKTETKAKVWVLPGERSKTGKEVVRPLSKAAIEVLDTLPNVGKFFFTTDGATPLAAYSYFKRQFDAKTGPLPQWQLHDLRRTARSLLSRAGISPDHASHCLGHTIGGMREVYDQYDFLQQKHDAFDALAALIERIVNPQANVVPFVAGHGPPSE
jgi:integrase